MNRWLWIAWAVALAAVILGLAWQVAYLDGMRRCRDTDLLILCSGPLDSWILPVSLGFGLVLIGIGAWRVLSRR